MFAIQMVWNDKISHNKEKMFRRNYCNKVHIFHISTKLAQHLSAYADHRLYTCKLRNYIHNIVEKFFDKIHSVSKRALYYVKMYYECTANGWHKTTDQNL